MDNFILVDIDKLECIPICLNCRDEKSKRIGNFAYDPDLFLLGQGMWAISDVFYDVDNLYAWAYSKGFYYTGKEMLTLCRTQMLPENT